MKSKLTKAQAIKNIMKAHKMTEVEARQALAVFGYTAYAK